LQRSFRDLRVILSEVADEGREVTLALLDEIASLASVCPARSWQQRSRARVFHQYNWMRVK
jgi:hypothetical protein